MSSINTNGLDVNYPIPGQNNSSQGFRNNFTNIKQNLNTAANEISDLQNKAVLKSALANSTLNNDMANTLIANASTLQFRNTMYNLGNALVGEVTVNCSLGDVQYGNLSGNVLLNFGSWAPTETLGTVKLQLGRPNANSNFTISFPPSAQFTENSGWALLENSSYGNNLSTISFPYDVTQINLTLTSTDCGNTIFVEPTNRPFQTTQVQVRTPPPTGFPGDVIGTVAVDENYFYVCTNTFNASSNTYSAISTTSLSTTLATVEITGIAGQFSCASAPLEVGTRIRVSGSLTGTGTITGYTSPSIYFVTATNGTTTFTLSDSNGNPIVTTAGTTIGLTFRITSIITFDLNVEATGFVVANMPVVFDTMTIDGNSVTQFGNINQGQVYYVKTVNSNTISISDTRVAGVAGPTLGLTNVSANAGSTSMDATFYSGSNIWKRVTLSSW